MGLLLLGILIVMAVVMTAGWVVQRAADNAGWADVFWTFGTGVVLAAAAVLPTRGWVGQPWRQAMVAILLLVWSIRLGGYVAVRVARGAEDARYKDMREEWGAKFQRNMFGLMIVQAPATALLGVSVLLAAHAPAPASRWADVIGALVLAAAIAGEGVADGQMKRFKADPANHGKVCDAGLWGWSRHPNYLFEALGWFAYPIIALDLAHPWSWASFTAPVFMLLLLRYGTGVPPLEAAMVKSRGDAYRAYQARVSPLLPRPPRRTAAPPKERAA